MQPHEALGRAPALEAPTADRARPCIADSATGARSHPIGPCTCRPAGPRTTNPSTSPVAACGTNDDFLMLSATQAPGMEGENLARRVEQLGWDGRGVSRASRRATTCPPPTVDRGPSAEPTWKEAARGRRTAEEVSHTRTGHRMDTVYVDASVASAAVNARSPPRVRRRWGCARNES